MKHSQGVVPQANHASIQSQDPIKRDWPQTHWFKWPRDQAISASLHALPRSSNTPMTCPEHSPGNS